MNCNQIYVRDIPYRTRKTLCYILDLDRKWEELAGNYLKYDMYEIRKWREKVSPTEELLTKMDIQNNSTVTELFDFLLQMEHHQALLLLKSYVDEEYHKYIKEGKENISSFSTVSQTNIREHERNTRNIIGVTTRNRPVLSNGNGPPASINNGYRESNGSVDKITDVKKYCSHPLHVHYMEILEATYLWNSDNLLGTGGFASVYKGIWKQTEVAIKKIAKIKKRQNETLLFLREIEILNSVRHDNVLPLYGFSADGDNLCLIYQLMSNGSLWDHLYCKDNSKLPLTWQQRHRIAVGTARGLQFLHNRSPPFIHCDIKSANILLDKGLEPRIGDFGLARKGPLGQCTHKTLTSINGTRPYLPHDYLRSKKMSTKVDTYSFGIVLFELSTGLRPCVQIEKKVLKDYIIEEEESKLCSLMDRKAGTEDSGTFRNMIHIGKKCVKETAKERPDMIAVLEELEIGDLRNMQYSPVSQKEENVSTITYSQTNSQTGSQSGMVYVNDVDTLQGSSTTTEITGNVPLLTMLGVKEATEKLES